MTESHIRKAVEEAPKAEDNDAIAAAVCPVTALGHRRGVFYYRTAEGELYAYTARDHTAPGRQAVERRRGARDFGLFGALGMARAQHRGARERAVARDRGAAPLQGEMS